VLAEFSQYHNNTTYPTAALQGKASRHHVASEDQDGEGPLLINGMSYGDHRSLSSLIEALSDEDPPDGWPVRLTHTVDPITGEQVAL
jgi:hypothetical protein